MSLKSCRGEPILKKGGGCCAPVGGVCLSQRLGVDIKKSACMLQQSGDSTARRNLTALILTLNWFQADTHQTEDTRMDREIVQSELTCQPERGISGYNGEYDT